MRKRSKAIQYVNTKEESNQDDTTLGTDPESTLYTDPETTLYTDPETTVYTDIETVGGAPSGIVASPTSYSLEYQLPETVSPKPWYSSFVHGAWTAVDKSVKGSEKVLTTAWKEGKHFTEPAITEALISVEALAKTVNMKVQEPATNQQPIDPVSMTVATIRAASQEWAQKTVSREQKFPSASGKERRKKNAQNLMAVPATKMEYRQPPAHEQSQQIQDLDERQSESVRLEPEETAVIKKEKKEQAAKKRAARAKKKGAQKKLDPGASSPRSASTKNSSSKSPPAKASKSKSAKSVSSQPPVSEKSLGTSQAPASNKSIVADSAASQAPISTKSLGPNGGGASQAPASTKSIGAASVASQAAASTKSVGANSVASQAPASTQSIAANSIASQAPISTRSIGANSAAAASQTPASTKSLGPKSVASQAPVSSKSMGPKSTKSLGPKSTTSVSARTSLSMIARGSTAAGNRSSNSTIATNRSIAKTTATGPRAKKLQREPLGRGKDPPGAPAEGFNDDATMAPPKEKGPTEDVMPDSQPKSIVRNDLEETTPRSVPWTVTLKIPGSLPECTGGSQRSATPPPVRPCDLPRGSDIKKKNQSIFGGVAGEFLSQFGL
ncbi:expressed unknown protein [Seminavis robusta]|uniref:Uncharacterized protein n=1 Tax=Seminavis robusta TaxID=568900 RepID=A0A9N8HB19_9STRA|nr:expressed unknown protein [Seminavis robusta]|eukprot:Sro262_g102050.1 n/a (613) ;mRNA; r:57205-59043